MHGLAWQRRMSLLRPKPAMCGRWYWKPGRRFVHLAAVVFEKFLNSFILADKDTIVGSFDDTAQFWGTGSLELVEHKAGIQAYFEDIFPRFPAGRAQASAVKYSVKVLSSNTVILSGSWLIRDTKEG